jgi:hypothetical protein
MEQLYQSHPPFTTCSSFRDKGFSTSVCGYLRTAKEWRTCIVRNNKISGRRFTSMMTINYTAPLSPSTIKDHWNRFLRSLRKTPAAGLWVREITQSNKLHYHILFYSGPTLSTDLLTIKESARRLLPNSRVRFELINNPSFTLAYVLKAKVAGHDQYGRFHRDLHHKKRLLFKPKTGLRKLGVFGNFWQAGWTKQSIWHQVRTESESIAKALKNPLIKQAVDQVSRRFGIPLDRVARSICLDLDSPVTQQWISKLNNSPSPRLQIRRGKQPPKPLANLATEAPTPPVPCPNAPIIPALRSRPFGPRNSFIRGRYLMAAGCSP